MKEIVDGSARSHYRLLLRVEDTLSFQLPYYRAQQLASHQDTQLMLLVKRCSLM